ncbi:MAG: glycosyltransferase, partial [Culicoidibacterales bacterium]
MKSILIVTSVASMVEQFLMPYIEEYSRKNIRVVVATNFENPGTISVERSKEVVQQLRSLSVEVEQVDFARSPLSTANFKAYKQLMNIMSKEKFDVIHSHSPIGGLLTRLAAKNHKNQKNAKVVYTA